MAITGGWAEGIKAKSSSLQQFCEGEAGQGGGWGQYHSDREEETKKGSISKISKI